jgi:tetratricopeptide (TPR) repeat protein
MAGRIMKVALAVTYLAVGIYFYFKSNLPLASIFVAGALFISVAIFRQGSVSLAIKAIRENNIPRAKFHVKETINPDWLSPSFQAYHFMAKGYVEASEGHVDDAIASFEKSLTYKVKHQEDKAVVHFQLAMLYSEKRDFEKAKELIGMVKKMNPNPKLSEQLKIAERKLKGVTSGRIKLDDLEIHDDIADDVQDEVEEVVDGHFKDIDRDQ